jgi:hypothetical protein
MYDVVYRVLDRREATTETGTVRKQVHIEPR